MTFADGGETRKEKPALSGGGGCCWLENATLLDVGLGTVFTPKPFSGCAELWRIGLLTEVHRSVFLYY